MNYLFTIKYYDYLSLDLPTPDLVIYLQAETKTLFERVIQRGREIEKNVSFEYLDLLNESYKEFFLNYDRSPVLIVNSEFLDLAHNQNDYILLLEKLLEYFNNPEGRMMYFKSFPFISLNREIMAKEIVHQVTLIS